MSSKTSYLLIILFGFILFCVSFSVVSSDPIELLSPGMWFFIGVSIVTTCSGIYKFIQYLIKSRKEKKTRGNGIHTTGTIYKIDKGTSINTRSRQTQYYFVTVKFINDVGEECLYQIADHFEKHTAAYFIKKGLINIIQYNNTCLIDEDTSGSIDIEDDEADKLIKSLSKGSEDNIVKVPSYIVTILMVVFVIVPLIVCTILLLCGVIFWNNLIIKVLLGIFALVFIVILALVINRIKKFRDYNL